MSGDADAPPLDADADAAAGADDGTDGTAGGADGTDGGTELGPPDEHPEWLSLDDGEEIQWADHPASATLIPAAIWGLLLLLVFGLGLVIWASAYLTVKNTDYVVTNTTLYHKRGVLSTNIESVGLDRIQNTEYTQSFFGKQLGYGTIEISTAGSSGSDVSFQNIENPREVRDLVNRLSNTVGATAGTAPGGEGAGTGTGAATAGASDELLAELAGELRAIDESMQNVERLLAAERGGDGTGGTTGTARGSGPGGAPGSSDTAGSAGPGSAGGGSSDTGPSAGDDSSGTGASGGSPEGSSGSASDFVKRGGADDEDEDAPPTPPFGDEE